MDLVILGVDGVDPGYLEEAIERRDMPNWEKLREDSFYSDLPSTVPSITVPAWQSMFSGYGPGKFDTYNMNVYDFESMESEIANSSNFRGKFFWDNIDHRVSLHYVPGTSPTYEVNGFMRSGFPSPGPDFYPDSLGNEIRGKFDLDNLSYEDERSIGELMLRKDADVFVSVIRRTDTEGHHASNKSDIFDAYEDTDSFLGEVMDKAEEENANLLVVSDHGFKHVERKFNVLKFLEKKDLLEFNSERQTSLLYRLAQPLLNTPLKTPMRKLHEMYSSKTGNSLNDREENILSVIDPNSKVLPSWKPVGRELGLKINTEEMPHGTISEEEKQTILEELETCLISLENNDQEVVEDIWRGEEIYEESNSRPDLVFRTTENFVPATVTSDQVFLNTNSFTHDLNGIFFAKGPDIDESAEVDLEIYDVAPLIYAILDEKAPSDMKGVLPTELVPNKKLEQMNSTEMQEHDKDYDEEEEEEVKDQLRKLGYM